MRSYAIPRSITWDERKFHEPKLFKPERFLPKPEGAGEIFPANAVFGWGRR
jgi:cytochrome P450